VSPGMRAVVALGVVGAGVYVVSKAMAKTPGDQLQQGDDAFVRVGTGPNAFLQSQQTLPGIPVVVDQIVVHVASVTPTNFQGMITAYAPVGSPAIVPLVTQIGPIDVPRADVRSVERNGAVIATMAS
jgi:hypothetical protein